MKEQSKLFLEIADNAMILSHRLAENSSKGPFLEEDLACSNVALDLIGLAEAVYNEIAKLENDGRSGDDVAFRRSENEYVNCQLVEQPNTDFAVLMVRQFFMDVYHYKLFTILSESNDSFLKAIAMKSLKEVTYHLKRSSEWMLRFGNGTETSNEKAQNAINLLWRFTDELFSSEADYTELNRVGLNLEELKKQWENKVNEILYLAHLKKPENIFQLSGGKKGIHSEYMGYLLAEMQFLTNKYPDAKW